jgi:hypothetical protein
MYKSRGYKIIEVSGDPHSTAKFDIFIEFGVIERWYLPVILSSMLMIGSGSLVVQLTSFQMSILGKTSLLSGCAFISIVIFWYVWKQGNFVLGVNSMGIFFRHLDDKNTLILIGWDAIENIAISGDGSGELEIQTNLDDSVKFPRFCNGRGYSVSNRILLTLYPPKLSGNTKKLISNWKGLKRASDLLGSNHMA